MIPRVGLRHVVVLFSSLIYILDSGFTLFSAGECGLWYVGFGGRTAWWAVRILTLRGDALSMLFT